MKTIGLQELRFSFRQCGVEEGDLLFVHSAFGSIGKVQGGAEAVIDVLMEILGPQGLLAMPAMTSPFDPFDPLTSKSNVGLLSETLRNTKGAVRSLFPVHSVVALGHKAEEFCSDHDKCTSGCGAGSPFYKLWQWNGKVLLLGVDQDRNTILHAFEHESKASYFMSLEIPAPLYPPYNGNGVFQLVDFPEGHRNFINITADLRENGLIRYGKVGNAVTQLMNAKELHDFCMMKLSEDPYYFLCKNPNCDFCSRARKGEKM